MKQATIPTPGPAQVSVLATLKIIFGEQEGNRVWQELALHPGIDIVANINSKTLETICQLRTKKV